MIDYVSGKLAENAPTHVVIDVGGMGIHLNTSLSSFETARKVGDPVRLFAHLHVREDVLALYGFSTDAERTLFRLLIGVSGIGPPMAQKILSGISIGDFRQLVLAGAAKVALTQGWAARAAKEFTKVHRRTRRPQTQRRLGRR